MSMIRPFLLFAILTGLCSGQAMAYRYGYYPPYPGHGYVAPRAYYPAPAWVSYAYPPYRHPAPTPSSSSESPAQAAGKRTAENSGTAPTPVVDKPAVAGNTVLHTGLSAKKRTFITSLLPYIEDENRRLASLRKEVVGLLDRLESNKVIGPAEQRRLKRLAEEYRVKGDPLELDAARAELRRKIDIIPASLALAQAVNESAWGESRFSREAKNLFGIWTYDENKGLKPLRREPGKKHLVRIFDNVGESVRYYMHNLNSHPAYAALRDIRQQLRNTNSDIDGHQLAAGLEKYSARGQVYIALIRDLIDQNEWALLDAGNRGA
jgi:Bax protein